MELKPLCVWAVDQFPQTNKPEICFIGRSNAGKSSLINSITKTKSAFVAKEAGKTKSINFFEQKKYFLVDMPGYGYSKNNKTKNTEMEKLINHYFSNSSSLNGIIHICCILGLTEQDIEMINLLSNIKDNYLLVLNKSDKLGNMQQSLAKKKIIQQTNLSEKKIVLISAKKSININLIVNQLNYWLQE